MASCKHIFYKCINGPDLEVCFADDGGIGMYHENGSGGPQLSMETATDLAHAILTHATLSGGEDDNDN